MKIWIINYVSSARREVTLYSHFNSDCFVTNTMTFGTIQKPIARKIEPSENSD
jgi:hypothetical protein